MRKSLLTVIVLLVFVLVVLLAVNLTRGPVERPPPPIVLPSELNGVSDCEVFLPVLNHYCPVSFSFPPKFVNGSELVANNPFAKLFSENESLQASFEIAKRTNSCSWLPEIGDLFSQNYSERSKDGFTFLSISSYPSASSARDGFDLQKGSVLKDLSRNWSKTYNFSGRSDPSASLLKERLENQSFVILDSSSEPNSFFVLAKNGFGERAVVLKHSDNFLFFAQEDSGPSGSLPCETSGFEGLFSSF